MKQRRIGAVVLAVTVLAACSSSSDDSAGTTAAAGGDTTVAATVASTTTTAVATTVQETTTTVAPTTSTLAVPAGSRYVAMGSSYAAGSGIPNQIEATCGRSDANYPSLVSKALGLQLVDVSCGGAVTANLIDTTQFDFPPQADALTPDTMLVTVTAGGNDLDYVGTAGACGFGDTPCTIDEADLQTKATALVASLQKLFDLIRERSPEATIVFVPYPRMVTETDCPALNFEPAEAEAFGTLDAALHDAFLTATADQDRVIVVDPYTAEGDHGACAPAGEAWITGNAPAEGSGYHPTPAEHVAVAEMVVEALGG